jgi:hypothetical protein
MSRVVVVSTHLDDAVFSCWSVIADTRLDVSVVTVFTAGRPGVQSAWDALLEPRIDSLARAAERRAEDSAALARAGRAPVHLPFYDGQFGPTDADRLVEALAPIVEQTELVYAPLAIANDEHVVIREAVRQVCPRPVFYVDYPYALRSLAEPLDAPAGLLDAYEAQMVELGGTAAAAKVAAALEYSGELRRLEPDFGVFTTAEKLGRETYFVPSSTVD